MIEKNIEIINKLGLHARAAAKLVSTASQYKAHIEIGRDDRKVNAKSIMGVMMLAANQGTIISLSAEGDDADIALETLCLLINNRFDESE